MSIIQTCPTDVVDASAERIWTLLTEPPLLADWMGVRLIDAPARSVAPGDRLVFQAAPGLEVVFDIGALQPPVELEVEVTLPFGVTNHEVIRIKPLDAGRCRVTYS